MSVRLLMLPGGKPGRRRMGACVTFCCTLLLGGAPQTAHASFYAFSSTLLTAPATYGNWTLTDAYNYGGLPGASGAGTAISPSPGTIVLTGINDGSFVPGWTGLTIPALGNGLFQFDYSFSTVDDPHFQYAGFIVGGSRTQLADTSGQAGTASISVFSGEVIGFYAGGDDQGGRHGVLTITDFSAPTPEPGSFRLLLLAGVVLGAGRLVRHSRLRLRPRKIAVAAAVAACLSVPGSAQQVYYTGINVTGAMMLTGMTNVSQQATSFAAGERLLSRDLLESRDHLLRFKRVAEKLRMPSPRPHPSLTTPSSPEAEAALGAMTAMPGSTALTVLQSPGTPGFNALSQMDQRLAYNGDQFNIEPPSPSIAAGNGYVLEGVNDAIQVYTTSGTPMLLAVVASNQLFGLAPAINRTTGTYGPYLTDMHVYFDLAMNRWLVMQWSQDNDLYGNSLPSSHLYLAVSQTGDPTANYNIYVMNTTNSGHPGCPCLPDYPQFGADQYGLHITWNEYTPNIVFVDTAVLTLSKASLAAGSAVPTAFQFLLPYVTGYEFSLLPATTPSGAANAVGTGGIEFLASAVSSVSFGNRIALWAMSDTSSLVTQNPNLTLTQVLIPTISYTAPPVAAQRTGPTPYGSSLSPPARLEYLDGGDTRVQSLWYAAGLLHMTFATGVNDANGTRVVGGAYVVLSPTYRSSVLDAQVMNQGYLFVNGNNLLRPALAVNAQGAGAIVVTLVGVNYYPSAAIIPFTALSTPSTLQVAAAGALPEDGFSGYPTGGGFGVARWGDYNSAVAASDGSLWMAAEYIGNYPRSPYANWNTYVIHTQP